MNNEHMINHMDRIASHYAHAKEKHPYFADRIQHRWCEVGEKGKRKYTNPTKLLEEARRELAERIKICDVSAFDVLTCELYEIAEATYNGRLADAIEECYDAVAVLLRMADMIAAEGGAA